MSRLDAFEGGQMSAVVLRFCGLNWMLEMLDRMTEEGGKGAGSTLSSRGIGMKLFCTFEV